MSRVYNFGTFILIFVQPEAIMNVGCRNGEKAFSRLIYQPPQKAICFLDYIHLNKNRQFSQRKLLANQRFAVEILEFRLSIIVINIKVKTQK